MVDIDDLFLEDPSFDDGGSGDSSESVDAPTNSDFDNDYSVSPTEQFSKISTLFTPPRVLIEYEQEHLKTIIQLGESEGKTFYTLLKQFLSTEDTGERSTLRLRLIPAYWNMLLHIVKKNFFGNDTLKLLLRYGLVSGQLLTQEQISFLSTVVEERQMEDPFYYLDEWLLLIGREEIAATRGDEVNTYRKTKEEREEAKKKKVVGEVSHKHTVAKAHQNEVERLEEVLKQIIASVCERERNTPGENISLSYSKEQAMSLTTLGKVAQELILANRKFKNSRADYLDTKKEAQQYQEDLGQKTPSKTTFSASIVEQEVQNIRNMIKMCVGRSGNHLPFLINSYFSSSESSIATRENVNNVLVDLEYLDRGMFLRTFKGVTTRIVPYFLLIPCYGSQGICWEPFDKYSRSSSKGRLAIPMFPRDLKFAVITALGDLRWQVAKEKADRFWMEEGITGQYYECFTRLKLKGDIRISFIADYVLWMTKESTGTQKLSRDVRSVFWRYLPFPRELREKLRNMGYVYRELYKKDITRGASSMY